MVTKLFGLRSTATIDKRESWESAPKQVKEHREKFEEIAEVLDASERGNITCDYDYGLACVVFKRPRRRALVRVHVELTTGGQHHILVRIVDDYLGDFSSIFRRQFAGYSLKIERM